MSHHWSEGEGPSDPKASREHADKMLKDPKYHAERGSEKDLRTVDDDLADPCHHASQRNEE